MEQVTAIIPSYGRNDLTKLAIARLRHQTLRPAEIIVVDDGSLAPFASAAEARVLRHDSNLGFAAAVNTGLRATQTGLAAILNNDVNLAPDWLERLASAVSEQHADFACGKLYRPDGRIDGTFDLLCRGGLAWRAGAGRTDGELWSRPGPIAFTSFTAVLGRAEAFREGGGLDESYHSYYEDVEWSLRAAMLNKTGYFEPSATGVHAGSATSGVWSYFSTRQLLRNHRRLAHQYLLPDYRSAYRIARTLLRAHCLNHGQWPDVPNELIDAKPRSARMASILRESEDLLYELQMASGADRLWRWYFQLVGRAG
ncbi:MAG: glycosyltransferase family 2 protein [Bryobacteraceae bacterium]